MKGQEVTGEKKETIERKNKGRLKLPCTVKEKNERKLECLIERSGK